MRAVVDTNVSFGALMDPASAPGRVLQAWREQRFLSVVSPPLLAELRGVLRWHKGLRRLLSEVEEKAELVVPPRTVNVPNISSGDNRVLETAVAGAAGYVVTNDRALLALQEFEGVVMVTPSRFLRILNAKAKSTNADIAGHGTEDSEGRGVGP